MPKARVKFGLGITEPAKLGTLVLKQTAPGQLSYTQNIDVQNDEYGNNIAVPGPALVTITNNAELTGVAAMSALYSIAGVGWLYIAEGYLGATNQIRRVSNMVAGGTPSLETTDGEATIDHSSHSGEVVTDMVMRLTGGTYSVYLVGKDATDGFIQKFNANSGTLSVTDVSGISSFNTGREPKLLLGSDTNLYIGHGRLIDKLSTADSYSNGVLNLPEGYGVTALAEWQLNLAVAYNTEFPHTFTERKSSGRSGVIIWDYTPNTSFSKDVYCPSRYISALVPAPTGNLLAFSGLDEGRTTLWEFTGYGFNKIISYIGEPPRSRHSVDFDGLGRILWQTADGQICRYNLSIGIFEHLGSITTGSSAGGLLRRAVGGTGNEFLVSSGTGSTYVLKRVTFGAFIGDGDSADGVTTPLVISEPLVFNTRVKVNNIELILNGPLVSGDNLELRLYKNGNATYINYGVDINSTADGTVVSSVRREQAEVDVSMAHLGVAFKATDARATSPGAVEAIIDYDEMEN